MFSEPFTPPPAARGEDAFRPQVLVIEDDPAILKLIETLLTSKGIGSVVATNLAQAHEILAKLPDFSVVLCDHLLPDGLGVEFLRDLRTHHPLIVRVLMTGAYDKALAMDAINSGEIYRFLLKPFTVDDLLSTLSQSFDRHDLQAENTRLQSRLALQNEELRRVNAQLAQRVAEEEARSRGLTVESSNWRGASHGMIDLCLEILQRIDPLLFKHSQRVAVLACAIARELQCDEDVVNRIEIAAQLHDIALLGCNVTLRSNQRSLNQINNPQEREQIENHPRLAAQLVKFLPLPDVLEAVEQHHEYLDGSGYPDGLAGNRISFLAQVLAVADSYDELASSSDHVLTRIMNHSGRLYAPEIVHALERAVSKGLELPRERQVLLHELIPGMKLSSSIYTATGMLLIKQGQVLNKAMIDRLLQHSESNAITQKILVEV
ncbi:MAG: response regulator [Verrucomicrobium sp.]|nr:response regulator [Verrucomicrobium sp.]